MARPKTKGDPLSFRLSKEAHEELVRRAAKAGVTPVEHLVAQLEKSLGRAGAARLSVEEFETNEMSARMEPPPKFHADLKPADFLGVAGPQNATVECRHWHTVKVNGVKSCTDCGETL